MITAVIATGKIGKYPTPGQRFSDKFPTGRVDKMTNARQMLGWACLG